MVDFVLFHSAPWRDGMIATGWRFLDSNATEPKSQWCYYEFPDKTSGVTRNIMLNHADSENAMIAVGFSRSDSSEAESKCVWFKGQRPLR